MGAIKQLVDASYSEIEAGGFEWRLALRRGTDLMEHGGAAMLVGVAASAMEPDGNAAPRELSDKEKIERQRYFEILVCSCVVAVREPGGQWETCRLTRARNEEDPEAGIAHISAIPLATLYAIGAEAMGACVRPIQDRLRPFRGSGDADPAGSDREAV